MKLEDLKEKVALVKLHCEAGTILEYMNLFDDIDKVLDDVALCDRMIALSECPGAAIVSPLDVWP